MGTLKENTPLRQSPSKRKMIGRLFGHIALRLSVYVTKPKKS